jgi:glycosyltransferase involved in cell wall biosynthesis
MQSYLVHMRDIGTFARTKGIHALLFQLVVGSKLTFIFLNPFLWLTTIAYFTLYRFIGPTIEMAYITPVFYIAAISLVFGNFLFLYYYMLGVAKRGQWDLTKHVLLIPIYWIMISIAGWVAFYQLLFKPHYWEKTIHGLHLQANTEEPSDDDITGTKQEKSKAQKRWTLPRPDIALPDFAFLRSRRARRFGKLGISGIIANNIRALVLMLNASTTFAASEKTPAILIFNWRDSQHVWAGGAEVYIQELAKRFVKNGTKVTIFCGNDGHGSADQEINGVEVIRRGGTYTVYIWAFFYYIFVFRDKYSLIVDCENGIPFFTPFYVRRPVVLLIHHVHQAVFREHLPFPLSWIAATLESRIMPAVYHNKPVITVSESSKEEIVKLGFSKNSNIEIVYNGIENAMFSPAKKTPYPSFVFVGRLKPYKNIDVCIKAFSQIVRKHERAILHIVGQGESQHMLQQLTIRLGLADHVIFHGWISEQKKARLLAQSWTMIQPSQVEGWGITVIEANASGTPVIASNVNGLKDSVVDGQTGILVEPRDVSNLAWAMQKLITDTSLRLTMSMNAYAWSKKFTWDKSARSFISVLNSILEGTEYASAYGKLLISRQK